MMGKRVLSAHKKVKKREDTILFLPNLTHPAIFYLKTRKWFESEVPCKFMLKKEKELFLEERPLGFKCPFLQFLITTFSE